MSILHALIASLRRDEEGQGLAEYALILALIAIVAIIALIFLGGQVSTILSNGRQLDLAESATDRRHDRRVIRRSFRFRRRARSAHGTIRTSY